MGLIEDLGNLLEVVFGRGPQNPLVPTTAESEREFPAEREVDFVLRTLEEAYGIGPGATEMEFVEGLERAEQDDLITPQQERAALEELEQMTTQPVEYSDWISIAFQVAREKGFRPDSTFSEGNNNAELVQVAAEIWNDRKNEIQTDRARARTIARQEIQV